MDTTTSTLATGLVVVIGRWTEEKEVSFKIFVGIAVLAVALAVMQASNEKLARQFGVLILVSALFTYGIPISKKIGNL